MDELKLQTLSSLWWASLESQFSSLILNWQLEVYPVEHGVLGPGRDLGLSLSGQGSLVAQRIKNLPAMQETWV